MKRAIPGALTVIALVLAWIYAATVMRRTEMGLPLDDSYIYLTYAKHPFVYTPGAGYSAGATSALWPLLLAPFHLVGARGHALVWVSYVLCALLYAATAVGAWATARKLAGEVPGIVAAVLVLGLPALTWTALSGMEVALTSALSIATVLVLAVDGAPTRRTLALLAATALSRPELAIVVALICSAAATRALVRRDAVDARRWLLPLVAPLLWFAANRVGAGQWMPNAASAKGQLDQPGFTWSAWWGAFASNGRALVRGLAWDAGSPLPQPRVFALLWIVGVVRLAVRERRDLLATAVIVGAPIVVVLVVLATTGLWTLQHYRYLAPVLPLLALPVAIALAPWSWSRSRWVSYALGGIAIAATIRIAVPRHGAHALSFAQGVADTNAQVVKLGRYLHEHAPDARLLLHDAGALAYYGGTQVIDMIGLVTDGQAGIANHGPGSRFEWLEQLAPDARPTHIAYYPGALGVLDFFGSVLSDGFLGPQFASDRVVGGRQMILAEMSWDHVGTGERPFASPGTLVDRVDVADLASERAHAWMGELGPRAFADPTTRWSFVAREAGERGLLIDGGRTIRGGRETFTVARSGTARLVMRTGGPASAPAQEAIRAPVTLRIVVDGIAVGTLVVPPPTGALLELAVPLPPTTAARSRIAITADAPYRVFHWFSVVD